MPPPIGESEISQTIIWVFASRGLSQAAAQFAIQVAEGESGLDPRAVGDAGLSHGLFQLHEQGHLPGFRAAGYTDPYDYQQQIQYVADWIAQTGDWTPWTAARNLMNAGVDPAVGRLPEIADGAAGYETPEERRERLQDELDFWKKQFEIENAAGNAAAAQAAQAAMDRLERQLAFESEEAALGRTFEAEQAGMNRELQLRLNRLSRATGLTEHLATLQQQAREQAVELMGQDPWRGAVMAQGAIPRGLSPVERYRREQMAFAEEPVPAVTGEMGLPQLGQAIEQTAGLIERQPQRPIGMAGGGLKALAPGEAVLVGEGGRPEVVEHTEDGMLHVIPLAGRSQEGGWFSLSTPSAMAQALVPLWSHLGMTEAPIATRYPEAYGGMQRAPLYGAGVGWPHRAPGLLPETFEGLGTRPRLAFDPELQTFFHVGPGNEVRVIGDAQRLVDFGFSPTDAVTMPYSQLKEMGYQYAADPYLSLEGGSIFANQRGQFAEGQPTIAPFDVGGQAGLYLPDPRLLASLWPTLDPETQEVALSAYEAGGKSRAQVLRTMRFFTPMGTQTAASTAMLR